MNIKTNQWRWTLGTALLVAAFSVTPAHAKVMADDQPDATEPSLKLWLRADALSLEPGAKVAKWTASAGSDAVEASTGGGPTYVAAGSGNDFNGKPAVRFDGEKNALVLINIPKAQMVVIVAKFNKPNPKDESSKSIQALFGADVAEAGNAWNYAGQTPGGYSAEESPRSGDRYWLWHLGIYRYSKNTFDQRVHVSIHEVDPAADEAGASTGSYKIFSDGEVVFTHPYGADNADGKLTSLGAMGFSGGYYRHANADIAEVLVYDRVLSPSEKNDIQTYLNKKYKASPASPK